MMTQYNGGCHCGFIKVSFETEVMPENFQPRACQCSFCRKHSTRALSDPSGRIDIIVHRNADLSRYQFGVKATEFLICRSCGVYVSAYMPDGASAYANVMADVLDNYESFGDGVTTDYGDEDEAGKRARRKERWTPARLSVAG